jgi:hypothetical protein
MGAWTGLLAGLLTAGVAALSDLATGAGLDGAARLAAAAGLGGGIGVAVGVVALGGPLMAVSAGLIIALLPLRAAGAASGLAVGLLLGASLFLLLRGSGADGVAVLLLALLAGLATGFLYSRYARTQLRPPARRPFARQAGQPEV